MDAKKLTSPNFVYATANELLGNQKTIAEERAVELVAMHMNDTRSSGYFFRMVKRTFDIVVATSALTLLSPFLTLIVVLIKLDSKGPVFFVQTRVGTGLLNFRIFKFRTMYSYVPPTMLMVQDDQTGKSRRPTIEEDPRITRLGRLLRKFSIDELPQLLNILLGDMSFIGPRPLCVDESLALPLEALIRYSVKPGLSGLAQVRNRSAIHGIDRFDSDIEYVKNQSFKNDLKIFLSSLTKFYYNY